MTSNASNLDSVSPYTGNESVFVGNRSPLSISHTGKYYFNHAMPLLDVLVVPHITKNLLSISKITRDLPVTVFFDADSFVIQHRHTKEIVAKGKCEHGLYVLDRGQKAFVASLRSNKLRASFELWHSR